MEGRAIQHLAVGDSARYSRTVSESDVYLFAGVTGDQNPMHTDEEYAKKTFFKGRIAHGILVGGLVSTVIGNRLPGPGTVYIRQELNFLAPVRIGDTVTAVVEVTEVLEDRNRVRLSTLCVNQHGKTVLNGEAVVSPPKA